MDKYSKRFISVLTAHASAAPVLPFDYLAMLDSRQRQAGLKPPTAFPGRFIGAIETLEHRIVLSAVGLHASGTTTSAALASAVQAALLQTPLYFEANQGQTDANVDFMSRGNGFGIFLSRGDAVLTLKQGEQSYALRMDLQNANHPKPRRSRAAAGATHRGRRG